MVKHWKRTTEKYSLRLLCKRTNAEEAHQEIFQEAKNITNKKTETTSQK